MRRIGIELLLTKEESESRMTPIEFLAYVAANLDQPCPVFYDPDSEPDGSYRAARHPDSCTGCNGTSRVPQPEMVALHEALTENCPYHDLGKYLPRAERPEICSYCGQGWRVKPGRVPRSEAEMHVALLDWLHDQNWNVARDAGNPWEVFRESKVLTIQGNYEEYGQGETLQDAAHAALEARA